MYANWNYTFQTLICRHWKSTTIFISHTSGTLRSTQLSRKFVLPKLIGGLYIQMPANVLLSDEVRMALEAGKPVVALESTIISHGMPYPQNLATAKEVEAMVRSEGAVPATIAVIGGVPRAGLSEEDLNHLAFKGKEVRKCSTRDLPLVVSQGRTVMMTDCILNRFGFLCGILTGCASQVWMVQPQLHRQCTSLTPQGFECLLPVRDPDNTSTNCWLSCSQLHFSDSIRNAKNWRRICSMQDFLQGSPSARSDVCKGGIGGVHRGGQESMDISADLTTAGKVPVLVVCAGVKNVLDIPRTLEFLETQGVCMCAYGSDNFPAFFSPDSGCKAPIRVDTPEEAAGLIRSSTDLGLGAGVIIGKLTSKMSRQNQTLPDEDLSAPRLLNDHSFS